MGGCLEVVAQVMYDLGMDHSPSVCTEMMVVVVRISDLIVVDPSQEEK